MNSVKKRASSLIMLLFEDIKKWIAGRLESNIGEKRASEIAATEEREIARYIHAKYRTSVTER